MQHSTYFVISPVRDEAANIDRLIASMEAQTLPPLRWVVVDDGSTDATGTIIDQAAAKISWITVIHRTNRGHRMTGAGVMEAFYDGYHLLPKESFDFLVKLDGDLSFEPDYFQRCFQHFQSTPKLGIGGGTVYVQRNAGWVKECPDDPPFHVRGATKIYRRAAWEAIGQLVKFTGWDTVDELKANMQGWETRTFKDVPIYQHRETGAADSGWRIWHIRGVACFNVGYHPLFLFIKALRRLTAKPYVLGSLALLSGFASGYLRRVPPSIDRELGFYLRQQQMNKLLFRKSIYD